MSDYEIGSNPYEILGVPETAPMEDIRKAYLRKVRLSPPERDPAGFKTIRKAYAQLQDGAKRRKLDLSSFRTASGIRIDAPAECDFAALYRDKVFELLLSASDLPAPDFSRWFRDITEDIKRLK